MAGLFWRHAIIGWLFRSKWTTRLGFSDTAMYLAMIDASKLMNLHEFNPGIHVLERQFGYAIRWSSIKCAGADVFKHEKLRYFMESGLFHLPSVFKRSFSAFRLPVSTSWDVICVVYNDTLCPFWTCPIFTQFSMT